MVRSYDLVVIGSGTAAQVASHRVRAAGWQVAVIDELPFGGTCALRGCDPKKVLISGAEAVEAARRMQGRGVSGEPAIAWADLIRFKRTFTEPVPERQEKDYERAGIATYPGHARFATRDTLKVGDEELSARFILIAAGARPVPLAIPGEEHVVPSDAFLELAALPKRVACIGGGYIAAEFSHIAARAGARVTIVQRAPGLLPRFDADLVGWLAAKFEKLGIEVLTDATVVGVEKTPAGFQVCAAMPSGERRIEADLVVHAAGRAPDFKALDAAAGGVEERNGRLVLNEFLQSVSNPKVYAAGDAAGRGLPLTPVAGYDARIAASNMLEGNRLRPNYRGVPSVAFTVPPIAAVGLSETEAKTQGLRFRVRSENTWDWYTTRRLGETVSGYKTLVDENSGQILGAHLVGPGADAAINLFALAIRHGLTAADLKSTLFAYPTAASDIAYMV